MNSTAAEPTRRRASKSIPAPTQPGLLEADVHRWISEFAYYLWVAEGRPTGHHEWHWQQSEAAYLQEEAWQNGIEPLQKFMLRQTRRNDLALFVNLSQMEQPATPEDVPIHILIPAFIISELKTAFLIGFVLYIPFLVIDIVISCIIMSMGMFMLPPVMIYFPFKILLFVLVDGWNLVVQSMVSSFR